MGINFMDGQWPNEGKWHREQKIINWKSWTKEIIYITSDPSEDMW
jgi:hypothetical protein